MSERARYGLRRNKLSLTLFDSIGYRDLATFKLSAHTNNDARLDAAEQIVHAANYHTDMLAALREMVRCHAEPSGPSSGNIVTGKMRWEANEKARAAISKATPSVERTPVVTHKE